MMGYSSPYDHVVSQTWIMRAFFTSPRFSVWKGRACPFRLTKWLLLEPISNVSAVHSTTLEWKWRDSSLGQFVDSKLDKVRGRGKGK